MTQEVLKNSSNVIIKTTNYKWDQKNQLVKIEVDGVSRTEFTYDGLGRRVRITEKNWAGGVTSDKYFVWDGLRIAQERASAQGAPTRQFFPQGEVRGGVKYYYTKDHQGSIREVHNASSGVVARYD